MFRAAVPVYVQHFAGAVQSGNQTAFHGAGIEKRGIDAPAHHLGRVGADAGDGKGEVRQPPGQFLRAGAPPVDDAGKHPGEEPGEQVLPGRRFRRDKRSARASPGARNASRP